MTVTAIDRRFRSFRVMPETEALDYANDVLALSREGHAHLVQLHRAHRVDGTFDWDRYEPAITEVEGRLTAISGVAHQWAGRLEASPVLSEGQLSLALGCPDGLTGTPGHGSAA